jgi:hypothetical protein
MDRYEQERRTEGEVGANPDDRGGKGFLDFREEK